MDLQNTQQEDAAQFKPLPGRNVQTPHHGEWQKKDEDVDEQVDDSIISEERNHIHTVSRNFLVPIPCEWSAA